MLKEKKGITLVALVVTIIVLLILAGVSITMVAGENGIMTKAQKAAEVTEKNGIIEDIKLEVSQETVKNLRGLKEEEFIEVLENYGTLSNEENILDKTLTTDPNKTDSEKSHKIPVSEIYNGSFYEESATQYSVTFMAYDEDTSAYSVYETVYVDENLTLTIPDTEPTRSDGYTFDMWVTEEGGSVEFDFENTPITENIILYASYTTTCFVKGTKVLTESGLINIEDVEVGMKVASFNEETEEIEFKEVAETIINDVTDNLGKVYVNGKVIESTVEHPYFVVGKGYTKVKELRVGDVLKTVEGEELVIENIEIIENAGIVTVYNFMVKDNHNYFVGEDRILVHNKTVGHGGNTPITPM